MSSRQAVWVARTDGAAYTYGTEIDALRRAVDGGMEVVRVPYGEDVLTYQPPGDDDE
jgi:hypothetical protein